jgi:hypothetical protein
MRRESVENIYSVTVSIYHSLLMENKGRIDYWRKRMYEWNDVLDILEGKISPEDYLFCVGWKPQVMPNEE